MPKTERKASRAFARPGRWKGKRPVIDSIWVGEECRGELERLAKAYGTSLSKVVQTFVMAHAGELDVAYEDHRQKVKERMAHA